MTIQWPLVVFTLFTCLASGIFAGAGIFALLGKGKAIQVPAVVASLIFLVIGGVASFLHLEHWDRAFNGFGNPTSGITQELIGIVVFVVALVVYFAVSRKEGPPKWAGALAVIVGVAMVIVMTTSYAMPARPAWSTPLLYVFYFSQMVAAGGAALWLIGAAVKADEAHTINARITAIGGVLVVISLLAYAAYISGLDFPAVGNYFDPTEPTKAMQATTGFGDVLFSGALAGYFWGAVIVGGAVVAILGLLKWKKPGGALGFSALALICALAGGLAFRAVLYLLGASVYVFY